MAAKNVSTAKSSKSAFIRSQPATMSAAEVVAKGKAAGVKISSSLVHTVRARAGGRARAATKRSSSAPGATKADFVRSRSHLSPKEIVEDAKAAGLELDVGYVYNLRGAARARSRVTREAARGVRAGAAAARSIAASSKVEALLKAVAAEIGLGRAIEILVGERARVRAAIGG